MLLWQEIVLLVDTDAFLLKLAWNDFTITMNTNDIYIAALVYSNRQLEITADQKSSMFDEHQTVCIITQLRKLGWKVHSHINLSYFELQLVTVDKRKFVLWILSLDRQIVIDSFIVWEFSDARWLSKKMTFAPSPASSLVLQFPRILLALESFALVITAHLLFPWDSGNKRKLTDSGGCVWRGGGKCLVHIRKTGRKYFVFITISEITVNILTWNKVYIY